jgi:hypothetical protein
MLMGTTETVDTMRADIPWHGGGRQGEPQAPGRHNRRDNVHIRHQSHEFDALTKHSHKPCRHLCDQPELRAQLPGSSPLPKDTTEPTVAAIARTKIDRQGNNQWRRTAI